MLKASCCKLKNFYIWRMKKCSLLSFLYLLLSCSDGDLQIETLDFDNIVAKNCGTLSINTELFFKINDTEALILILQSAVLKNEITTEDIKSTVPSQSKLIYRTFSDKVTTNYFCDNVPTVSPTVQGEIKATKGFVIIKTVASDNDTFEHTIKLSNITLLKDDGTRITDLTINDFAKLTTKP